MEAALIDPRMRVIGLPPFVVILAIDPGDDQEGFNGGALAADPLSLNGVVAQ
jgi:hypothetical protein